MGPLGGDRGEVGGGAPGGDGDSKRSLCESIMTLYVINDQQG